MSDLIERLKAVELDDPQAIDALLVEAITALSPVLPDELDEVLKLCQTPRTRDLLERQAREIELDGNILKGTLMRAETAEQRIEELETEIDIHDEQMRSHVAEERRLQAQVKELEAARNEALEYLQREGTPYVNSAIAALQENE